MAKSILVVDDEPDIMEIATVRLRHLGYKILTAFDAEEALTLLQNNTPELIILDLLLPNMQGDELCRCLKSDAKFKTIPIILFTASAVRVLDKVEEIGADDYIIKPFEPEELLRKVRKFIGGPV